MALQYAHNPSSLNSAWLSVAKNNLKLAKKRCKIMNETLWTTPEEAIVHFLLGGTTIFVYVYAMFLSSAIHDYQDEKPAEEKCPLDHQIQGNNIDE